MEHKETAEFSPSMPVLSRFDRLDRLLELLEERLYLSARHSISTSNPLITKMKKEDNCRTLSCALEEVNHKGTLMKRLTMLETRVLQLSLEMEVGNTSGSSSSTIQMPEKIEPTIVRDEQDPLTTQVCETKSQRGRNARRGATVRTPRKRFGWFRMGC